MAQARFIDTAEGWDIFQEHRGEITLLELNQALRSRGFRRIHQRTFDHYHKLQRLGYDDYVSINRLDLRHSTDSVFDVLDRSRYRSQPVDVQATLYVPAASGIDIVVGLVTGVSEESARFSTTDVDILRKAGRSAKYNRGVLRFDRTGVERVVRVQDVATREGRAEAVLVFRSLLTLDILLEQDRPRQAATFSIDLGLAPSLYDLTETWQRTFDLMEASRAIAQGFVDALSDDQRRGLASTRVDRITLSSPLELHSLADPLVLAVILYVFRWVRIEIQEIFEIRATRQQIRNEDREEERRDDRHEYEITSRLLDDLKKALEVGQLIQDLDPSVREALELGPEVVLAPNPDRLAVFKDQVIEAVTDLLLNSDSFTIEPRPDNGEAVGGGNGAR